MNPTAPADIKQTSRNLFDSIIRFSAPPVARPLVPTSLRLGTSIGADRLHRRAKRTRR